jgi:putative ABC transport system ATP-binding protein
MIDISGLTKIYGRKEHAFSALSDVTLKIPDSVSVAIVGKSGSGKSTLMHVVSGLDHPTAGRVLIDGDDIFSLKQKEIDKFRSQKIGFIFQSFFVQGAESCYENVSLPLEIAGVPRSKRREKIEAALNAVDLGDKMRQKAKNLSGGQKQRLAIARAIVAEPRILFADEPTGNLDSTTGTLVENFLFDYAGRTGATLVIVTHDDDLAQKCDMRINIKDGKIVSSSNAPKLERKTRKNT